MSAYEEWCEIEDLLGDCHVPQVGIAEVTGSQAVCAVTEEVNGSVTVAKKRAVLMLSNRSLCWVFFG